jgi:DNA adenine methylase
MPAIYTPLRYPGGKSKLGPYLSSVLRANRLIGATYSEPYAGGAGAALYLLFRGYVTRIVLNDLDRAVVSFWRAVLQHNERFARLVEHARLNVREWDRQRQVLRSAPSGFDLGFAFFYVNRTSRSGIMNGGVIGGRRQRGEWLIDARFNAGQLAERIRAIGTMRRYISVTRRDALEFLDEVASSREPKSFTYLDPPYYDPGEALYTNHYAPADHAKIARRLGACTHPWLLTYDDCPEIRGLYRGFRILDCELSYSAREVRRGREVIVLGRSVNAPTYSPIPRRHRPGFAVVGTRRRGARR